MHKKQAMVWQAQLITRNGVPVKTIPVTPETIADYCQTGIAAYLDHYTQLWQEGDPSPYFNQYYREEQVARELENPVFCHGLVQVMGEHAGIFKLDLNRSRSDFHPGEALFLEKIYFKKAFTGLGLGSTLIQQFFHLGRELGKKGLWLEAMYKGPARAFYLQQGFRFLAHAEVPYPEILPAEKAMWVMGREI